MKIRFIKMLSILCTLMLIISAVSAWAFADPEPATPTDLSPAGEEYNPEEEEEKPEKGPESETESEDENEEESEEGSEDSDEILITKTLALGQAWEGTVGKKSPAVLMLELDRSGSVYLLAEGKDVWATVNKADDPDGSASRLTTDPETGELVYEWEAEAGNYIITLGPVEPNLMAIAKVTFMGRQAYEEWEAAQVTDETETEEESEPESAEEGDGTEETPDESEPEDSADEEESGEEEPGQDADEEPEEPAQEAEELPDDETMLAMGFYKVQVASAEGTDLYGIMDGESEAVDHLESGAELWLRTTENEIWAELYRASEEIPPQYVMWDSVIIILKPAAEEEEEAEPLPARYIEVTSTLTGMEFIPLGQEITMTAELINFREEDLCTFQWLYCEPGSDTYISIEGANEPNYTYYINRQNIFFRWKIVVTVENEEQEEE